MLRARLATAAVAIPALLALILYPSPWPIGVFVVAVGIVGLGEYAAMTFPTRRGERAVILTFGTLLLGGGAATPQLLGAALALTVIGGLVWVLAARPDFEQGVHDLGLAWIGIFYVGLLLPYFLTLRSVGPLGPRWVIFVLTIGMVGDSSGYFVGRALGRHRLTPRVSPGKTVEGALGIVAGSLLAGAASKLLFLQAAGWREVLLLSVVMAILGQLGDLSESVMKRTFTVKESGWLFPGHGGVLDRIDSLLFPVTFLYYYIVLFR